ncbi:MAG TPA: hypothetical protein VFI75_07535, partial [Candidatus Acidoferrum sp.]|nr:hypothetical protein [Candidatus Acidoferrum sp.]
RLRLGARWDWIPRRILCAQDSSGRQQANQGGKKNQDAVLDSSPHVRISRLPLVAGAGGYDA